MGRAPCCDKVGLNKGTWTVEEDAKLVSYVLAHGHHNWRALPKLAGLLRCGKSCRLRWFNYLRPDIKRGHFTREEEETIIKLHSMLGNKWSKMASCLPGRTDNEIKNVWNTYLKKRAGQPKNTAVAADEAPSDDSSGETAALIFEIPIEASIDDLLNSLPSSSEAQPEPSPCSSSSSSSSSSSCKIDNVTPEEAAPGGIPELDPIWKLLEGMEEEFEAERAPMGGGGGWLDYLEKELGLDEDAAVLDPAAEAEGDPIYSYFEAKSSNFFPY